MYKCNITVPVHLNASHRSAEWIFTHLTDMGQDLKSCFWQPASPILYNIIFTYNCTEMSGAGSHRGEAHRLECWSPGLQPRIPPWCRPSRRRGRREVCPLPRSLRPRAAAGLCVCGGSAAGAHTHVEINSHLSDTENFYLHFWVLAVSFIIYFLLSQ